MSDEHDADRPEPGDDDAEASRSFDAAFDGEDWGGQRRRRRSSSSRGSSSSDRSDSDSGGSHARRESGERDTGGEKSSSERRRARRRNRHVRAVVVHAVLGLLGLAVAWVVVTAVIAALQLHSAQNDLKDLRSQIASGDTTSFPHTADDLAAHAHHAQVMTTGPAWATLAAIPYVGDPFETFRGITAQTSQLADRSVPGLLAAAQDVNPKSLIGKGASIDLTALSKASGPVHDAAGDLAAAHSAVDALPKSTWLPFVDSARNDLDGQLGSLAHTMSNTDSALQVLPTMLGAGGQTKRYFVAFQNNAELRGTGGLPGAFAIVTATNGTITAEQFESDGALANIPSGLDFGKFYNAHYGLTPYSNYLDSNSSPNFPYAAQIWLGMWKSVTGQQLDGALTLDPAALSYLLDATGPATAPDGTVVSGDNVVSLLQKDVYAKFPDREENDDRKDYILSIAEAAEKKVLSSSGNPRKLLQALAQGVSERRIVAWSTDDDVEQVLANTTIGGTVADTAEPYAMLSLNNGAAGKLDYYLDRSLKWERTGCGDTRTVTVTITLHNDAPASGLPPYVTNRGDDPKYPTVPGQNRTVVDYIATNGAQLQSSALDGKQVGASVYDEEGHPDFGLILELTPGQTSTWVLTLTEPAGDQPVTVVHQPAVNPLQVDVDDRSCS